MYDEFISVYKALADETRLKIINMLSCGEMCACEILEYFRITQPTLSYHMKILTECGLVKGRKDGSWMRYSLNNELVDSLNIFWNGLTTKKEEACICNSSKEISKS